MMGYSKQLLNTARLFPLYWGDSPGVKELMYHPHQGFPRLHKVLHLLRMPPVTFIVNKPARIGDPSRSPLPILDS